MTLPAAPAWVPWTGTAVLALGVIMVALALLSDWAKGVGKPARRRCPRCWYDMAGVTELRCPECGRTVRSERKLVKARRRWGWVAIGLLLAPPGALSAAYPRLAKEDWLERIPSWVLVRYADPITPPQPYQMQARPGAAPPAVTRAQLMARELGRRYERGELSLAVRRSCTREQFGTGVRDPISIETRPKWPAGVPVLVNVRSAFQGPLPRSMIALPQFPDATEVTAYDEGWGGGRWFPGDQAQWLQSIGAPPLGASEIVWRLAITEGDNELWSGTLTSSISVGGSVDEVIQPVVLPAASEAIQRSLTRTARLDGIGVSGGWLVFEPVQMPELAGVTVGLVIEFRYDKKPVAAARTVWVQDKDAEARQGPSGWYIRAHSNLRSVPLEGNTAMLSMISPDDPRWTIYVRGDGEMALRDFKATNYWRGEFEMPATALHE